MNSVSLRSLKAALLACFWLGCVSIGFSQTGQRAYGGSDHDFGTYIASTNDGGYVTMGTTLSFPVQNGDALLTKFNSKNEVEWSKVYGDDIQSEFGNLVIPSTDGGYLLVWSYVEDGFTRSVVAKIDSEGNILKQITITDGPENEFISDIRSGIQLQTGEFVIFGNMLSPKGLPSGWVSIFSKEGELMRFFEINQEDPLVTTIQDGISVFDGASEKILICGNQKDESGILIKLDPSTWEIAWTKVFTYKEAKVSFNALSSDGKGIKLGGSFTFNSDNDTQACIFSLDNEGQLLSAVSVGNQGNDIVSGIRSFEGNAIVYGTTMSEDGKMLKAMAASITEKGGLLWANSYQSVSDSMYTLPSINRPNLTQLIGGDFAMVATNSGTNSVTIQNSLDQGVTRIDAAGSSSCDEIPVSFSFTRNLVDENLIIEEQTFTILETGFSLAEYFPIDIPILPTAISLCAPSECIYDISLLNVSNPTCYYDTLGVASLSDLPEEIKQTTTITLDGSEPTPFRTSIVTGLGTHQVIITYNETCKDTINFDIVAPPRFDFNLSVTQPTGPGSNDGRIVINNVGNTTPPLLYKITGKSFSSITDYTNLSDGAYFVTVRDANNCLDSIQVVIEYVKCGIDIEVMKTDITCAGSPTGILNITALTGNPPFQYSIDNGNTFSDASTFANLIAGTYIVVVKDLQECVGRDTVQILESGIPIIISEIIKENPVCGQSNGKIEILATGDELSYSIDGMTFDKLNVFENLASGFYTIYVKDINGCTQSQDIPLFSEGNFAFNLLSTDVTCFGSNDAKIEVRDLTGTPPYQYSLDGKIFQSDSIFTGLSAPSMYTIYVTDAQGCLVTDVVSVSSPEAITVTLDKENPECAGGVGVVNVMASGGTPPYEYSLDDITYQGSQIFTDVPESGVLTVYVRDSKGCKFATEDEFKATVHLVIDSLIVTNATCGRENGGIRIHATGGSGQYQYSLDGGNTWSTISDWNLLKPLKYKILVRDANSVNCFVETDSIEIKSEGGFNLAFTTEQPSCDNPNSGKITVFASGGQEPYVFSINGGNFASNNVFEGLNGGNYTISVMDFVGCRSDSTITLVAPGEFQSSLTSQDISCFGKNDGSITVNVEGTGAPFTYKIVPGSDQFGTISTFNNLLPGNYTIIVKSSNGCIDSLVREIIEPSEIIITLDKVDPSCGTSQNGQITAIATGGTGDLEYSKDGISYSSNNIFDNLSVGKSTIFVRDQKGCTKIDSIILEATGSIYADSINVSNTPCGSSAGAITVFAKGENLQYSINGGNTYQEINIFTQLSASTYSIIVKDSVSGCESTPVLKTVIEENLNLNINLDVVNPSCSGGVKGKVTINVDGGEPPYEYSKDGSNFSSNNLFEDVSLGTFTAYVKDASGCVGIKTVVVTGSTGPEVTFEKEDPKCASANDGRVTLFATGGLEPYSYSSDSVNFSGMNVFFSLGVGTYKFYTKEAGGCVTETSVTLETTAGVKIDTIMIKDATCNSGNGEFTVIASNGSGNYKYAINGPVFGEDSTFRNLPPNNYFVTVLDVISGCSVNQKVTIGSKADLDITFTVFSPSCNNDKSGAIQINASGGIMPYLYSTDPHKITFTTGNLLTNVAAGTYVVFVKDAFGCLDSAEVTVEPYQPVITTYKILQKPGCGDNKTGTFSVESTGGSGGIYVYSLNNVDFTTNATFANLPEGNYKVYTKDLNGCYADTLLIAFEAMDSIAIESVDIKSPTCGMANGEIIITAYNGGNGQILYSINGTDFVPDNKFDSLAAGTYKVYIKNEDGCILENNAQLAEQGDYKVTLDIKSANCASSNDGEFTILTVEGGKIPYVFSIDGVSFVSDSTFKGLDGGTYTLYIKDVTGCLYTESVEITAPEEIEFSTSKVQPTCYGIPNGSITVSASGGTPPYEYSADGITYQASPTLSNLVNGIYLVYVRDINTCVFVMEDTLKVIDGREPVEIAEVIIANPRCEGVDNGRAKVIVKGGKAPYTYSLDGVTFQNSATFLNLGVGNYTIYIKDADTCGTVKPTTFTLIPRNGELIKDIIISRSDCQSNSASINVVTNSVFEGMIYYSLDDISYQTNPVFTNLLNGEYTVYVKYANGCRAQRIINIEPSELVEITDANVSNVTCYGKKDGMVSVSATVNGAEGDLIYSIDGINYQKENKFESLAPGNYTVSARSITGCIALRNITIAEPAELVFGETFTTEPLCERNNDGLIRVSVSGGTGNILYSLSGGDFGPSNEFTNLIPKLYTVYAKDENGCIATKIVDLKSAIGMTISLAKKDASNFDATDGEITVSVSDGKGPFMYSIDGVNFSEGNQFFELGVGYYTITVRDFNGCEKVVIGEIGNRNSNECASPEVVTIERITLTSAMVRWTPVSGSQKYQLRYRIFGSDKWSNMILNTNITDLYSLQPNSLYEVQVRNMCLDNLSSPYTSIKTFTTNGGCDVPVVANIETTTESAIVNWSASAGAVYYTISYRLVGSGNWTNFVVPAPTTSYELNNLKPGQRYSVRFKSKCDNAETSWSYTYSFVTNSGRDGIADDGKANTLSIYPNPNKGDFTISFHANQTDEIVLNIVDITGRSVMNQKAQVHEGINELPVNLTGNSTGVYLLQITSNGETFMSKIVIE